MCRHLGWLGTPTPISALVLDPPNGLLVQSYSPRRQKHGLLNADGWGVGFFAGGQARRWRSAAPLWGDASFASVAPALTSGCVVAAVRSATVGMPVESTAASTIRSLAPTWFTSSARHRSTTACTSLRSANLQRVEWSGSCRRPIASYTAGTLSHVMGLMLNKAAGLDMVHVGYRGSPPALQDVMGGQVQFMFDGLATSVPNIKAGKLRAFAVSSPERSHALPDVPTLAELGYPDMTRTAWLGLWGHPDAPAAMQQRLRYAHGT